ncbi:pantetheine-phosphate adenylyltransferase [soil metagenome]
MPKTIHPRIALYPGSFDGLTYGHLDLIQRGRKLFDKLIVGVAANSRKAPWFTVEERIAHLSACTAEWPNVEAMPLEGLTVDMAEKLGAQFILRGLRAVSDFDFEFQLAIMNQQLKPNVETIFMAPAPEFIFLSSSMVKEVWSLGGDVSRFVPAVVLKAFEAGGPER